MNTFCGVGRLTADPQTRKAGDHEVTSFRLALDRARSDGADFITVEAWDRLGEVCRAYLASGREVAVTGRIRHDEFSVEGKRRHDYRIVAAQVEFLGKKEAARNGDAPDTEPATAGF